MVEYFSNVYFLNELSEIDFIIIIVVLIRWIINIGYLVKLLFIFLDKLDSFRNKFVLAN